LEIVGVNKNYVENNTKKTKAKQKTVDSEPEEETLGSITK
jgi:hypothetical protein